MEGALIVVLYFWKKHDGQTAEAAVSCPQSATLFLSLQYKSLPRRESPGFETLTQQSVVLITTPTVPTLLSEVPHNSVNGITVFCDKTPSRLITEWLNMPADKNLAYANH
jgi:hypothetical protein